LLALTFSILLTLYLIIPDAIFRFFFSRYVPLRSLVPTRVETIYRAVALSFIPFVISTILVFWAWPFNTYPLRVDARPGSRSADYKTVMAALYSEDMFKKNYEEFWPALNRSTRRQCRLLSWYYVLVVLEGVAFGFLSSNYGKYQKNRIYSALADGLLLPNISEWHVFLTAFVFADKKSPVLVDVLCTDGTLYDGQVTQYFLDGSKLSGMILDNPRRYDRKSLLADREMGKTVDPNAYWRKIPSANFYVFADKILNINLKSIGVERVKMFVSKSIGDAAISVTIKTGTVEESSEPSRGPAADAS
jgi:hypothetical protein